MPRIRTIKPEFFSHEGIADQPFAGRLLAIALLQLADRAGRMRWIPKAIEAHTFPYDEVDLEALAIGLERIGYLVRYEVGGRRFAAVLNFERHQRITGKEAALTSKFPEPPPKGSAQETPDVSTGNKGETPERFPGKQVDAQGTGEQGNRGTGEQGENKGAQAAPPSKAIADVYEAFRLCDPQARSKPSDARRADLRTRLKDHSPEDLILMLEWARLSPDYASQRDGGYLRWITLLGKNGRSAIEDRISAARRWNAEGRPTTKRPATTRGQFNGQAAMSWPDRI
jgi:hypothetical protein